MNYEYFYSSSVENAIGNLIEITLNLWIAFGSIVIFTIFILPTQEEIWVGRTWNISASVYVVFDFFH